MKSELKKILVSSISMFALCCTLSHAATYSSSTINIEMNISDNQLNSLALPKSEQKHQLTLNKVLSSGNEFSTKEINKKNEFFELAAVFNDKLQLLLSTIHTPNESENTIKSLNEQQNKHKSNELDCMSKRK